MSEADENRSAPVRLIVWLIAAYQRWISPLLGPHCRFHPTCSAYGRQSIETHGLLRGTWLLVARIGRCHPWHPGGVDLPPPARGKAHGDRALVGSQGRS